MLRFGMESKIALRISEVEGNIPIHAWYLRMSRRDVKKGSGTRYHVMKLGDLVVYPLKTL